MEGESMTFHSEPLGSQLPAGGNEEAAAIFLYMLFLED
jgi:hypothetical protein